MKKLLLLLMMLALPVSGWASTYNVVGGPYGDGYYPPYLYSFNLQLAGTGNVISWVTGSLNHEWACSGGGTSQGGFIFTTLGGVPRPCANSLTYVVSGTTVINGCSGPSQATETFDDGSSLTVYFTYVKGGRFHNVCQGRIVSGTLTVN